MDFTQPPESPNINCLVYGPPKTRKTTGACTSPGGTLLLNADLPNATRYAHRSNPDGRLLEVQVPPYEEGKLHAMDLIVEISNMIMQPDRPYVFDTVVIDPVGELFRQMLEEQARRQIRPKLNDYGDIGVHLERFCRFLCKAPVNVVLVAHELAVEDEASGEVTRMPFMGTRKNSAALGSKVLGMVDVIAYTGVVEKDDGSFHYLSQLISGKGRHGGDRFACLGDTNVTDMATWLETIKASEAGTLEGTETAPQSVLTRETVAA